MKSMFRLKLKLDWIVVVDDKNDDDCLDLPSLTTIQCKGNCKHIHPNMGRVILESMILKNPI